MHIAFPFFASVTIVYLLLNVTIYRQLRLKHPGEWDRLGKPSFWNNSPANGIRFLRFFIFSSEYKKLGDAILDRYVLVEKALFACWFVLFIASFFLFFGHIS